MKDLSDKSFGILIAFGLPGFLLLWGFSLISHDVAKWLSTASAAGGPTIGGFLYATVASFALGLLLSALRWATVEQIIYRATCVERKHVDQKQFADDKVLAAYQAAIDNVYRYYQFYAHTFLVILIISAVYFLSGHSGMIPLWGWAIVSTMALILFVKSRAELININDLANNFTSRVG